MNPKNRRCTMNISQASGIFLNYHTVNSSKNMLRNHQFVVTRFSNQWGERDIESITSDEILIFLTRLTEGAKQSTKRLRYALLSAFFTFVKNTMNPELQNPCDTPMMRKVFRVPRPTRWKILDKETVDEVIFRTVKVRNRLILELMARGGMRVGEVLNLTPRDIEDRNLALAHPKSGKESEVVYISDDAHDALVDYLKLRAHCRSKRVFLVEKGVYKGQPISVRGIQKRMEYYAKKAGVAVSCHRLRHTMATKLLNAEAEVETIQDLLGHNWITTTQRYCRVSNLKVQRDYFKAMAVILGRTAPVPPGAQEASLRQGLAAPTSTR
jgi:integrase/recombinase XerD